MRDIRNLEPTYLEAYGAERKFALSEFTNPTGRNLLCKLCLRLNQKRIQSTIGLYLTLLLIKQMDNYIRFTLLNLNPSDADVLITKKIRPASEQLDINLLDHLILSPEEKYYSMADEGVIKFIEEI